MSPRVVLPFTKIAPGVEEALATTGLEWEPIDVSGDETAYFHLIRGLWQEQQTFVVVEHDVIVRPECIGELLDCHLPWCAFPIPYLAYQYAGMACVKFDAEIMERVPAAMDEVGKISNDRHPAMHWCTVDGFLRNILSRNHVDQHVHLPALGHYRPYGQTPQPSHGCCGDPIEETDDDPDLHAGLDSTSVAADTVYLDV